MKSNYPENIVKVRDLKFENGDKFEINFLFPVPLYRGTLNISDKETNHIKNYLYDLSKTSGRHLSNYNAWQSNDLIKDSKLDFLLEKIGNSIVNIFENENFAIIDLWGNITPRSGYNRVHNHIHGTSKNHFAGVFYLELPPNKEGHIGFCNPSDVNSTLIVPVMEKELILFPSSLFHFVDPNPISKNRISLAFNVLFDEN